MNEVKRGSSEEQKLVNKYFPKRPIAYQPGLTLIFRSLQVGVFLSQLLYWNSKGSANDRWIYKTVDDMREETGLSRSNQETAIKKLKNLGYLETKRAGIPAKRHFKLDINKLVKDLPRLKESVGLVYLNPPPGYAEKQPSITESTQQTTAKNNPRHISNVLKNKYGTTENDNI